MLFPNEYISEGYGTSARATTLDPIWVALRVHCMLLARTVECGCVIPYIRTDRMRWTQPSQP